MKFEMVMISFEGPVVDMLEDMKTINYAIVN